MPQPVEPKLPELRQDLRLEHRGAGPDGAPTWVIVDTAQHRYVALGETAYQILSIWKSGASYSSLQAQFKRDFGHGVSATDIADLVTFLAEQNLTLEAATGDWRHFATVADRGRHGWLMWLVHNYLYVKLPLFRPQAFLDRMAPWVAPLYSRIFLTFVVTCGIVGLYLVSRQWDAFLSTFQHFFSFDGALAYGAALIVVKSLHELGHAFTAHRFGCRVPSMGVCFLVMFPVLYTDVTDAWRLRSRRKRLLIGASGVAVELAIACLATLAWVFLPEGPLKSVAFTMATVGWILSLAVNLNPLMRFDGYYLFADAIGIENLQARSFALGQWRLRELLFGLGRPAPERLSASKTRLLVAYAWATWIYRFVLFAGIALLVYHMTFKLLGIALFLVEIGYFIVLPVWRELGAWRREGRRLLSGARGRVTVAIGALLALIAVTPWSTHITMPAIIEASDISRVYPQRSGFVTEVRVKTGDAVKAGDVLVVLSSRELQFRKTMAQRRIKQINLRLARRGSDLIDLQQSMVMQEEQRALLSEIDGIAREAAELEIRSPIDGDVVEFNSQVHADRAIDRGEFIALIRNPETFVARGYLSGRDVARVEAGAYGKFIPDGAGLKSAAVKLHSVSAAGSRSLEIPELASTYGGPIAVRQGAAGSGSKPKLTPVEAAYLSTLDVLADAPAAISMRGVVRLEGSPRSYAGDAFRSIAAVLVRESGF